jgi:hypothetical protein
MDEKQTYPKQKRQAVNHWKNFTAYVSKARIISYWHQIDEVVKSNPKNILEIGVGSNFVGLLLSSKNYNVITYDLEPALGPIVAGSVTQLPFKPNSFDTVLCCQVLEHLPFELFNRCLLEIRSICRNVLVLSLPDKTPALSGVLRMPNFIFWDFLFTLPFAIREPLQSSEKHFWEIGRWGFPFKRIRGEIRGAGYFIIKSYRVPEFPYHRFFIAQPNEPH